jgi:predicted nucleic acid-binding protein
VSRAFADTSYFLALLSSHDPAHRKALSASRRTALLITTEFILLEFGNACARADDHADFLLLVDGMRSSPHVRITPLSTELFDAGLARMRERSDKDWSLTDCISFVVMEREGLHDALTGDHHFEQAGFNARLK